MEILKKTIITQTTGTNKYARLCQRTPSDYWYAETVVQEKPICYVLFYSHHCSTKIRSTCTPRILTRINTNQWWRTWVKLANRSDTMCWFVTTSKYCPSMKCQILKIDGLWYSSQKRIRNHWFTTLFKDVTRTVQWSIWHKFTTVAQNQSQQIALTFACTTFRVT